MKNLIRLVKCLSVIDTGLFQKVRCALFGKTQDLKVLSLYGISFCPPTDQTAKPKESAFGVGFMANGYSDEVFVIVDRPDLRFKGLLPSELKIGNYKTNASVYFKADGTIEIKAPTVNVIGDVIVTGDVTGNNFISTGLPDVDFNTHVHSDPQGGDTGVPK